MTSRSQICPQSSMLIIEVSPSSSLHNVLQGCRDVWGLGDWSLPHFSRLVKVTSQDLYLGNVFELVTEFEFSWGPFCSNYRVRAKPLVGSVSAMEPSDVYSWWSTGLHMRHLFVIGLHLIQEGLRSGSFRGWEWQRPISRAVGNPLPDFPMWYEVLVITDQLTCTVPLRRSYSMSDQDNHDKSTKGSSYRHTLIVTYPTYITKFKFHDYQWNRAKVIKQRHL